MKISIKNVQKDFKKVTVLRDVNLELESGKAYGLCGRNGSGKTILLKLLCGLITPSKGEIYYDNELLTVNNAYKFNIGALIENPKFIPELTGYKNLELLSEIKKKINKEEIEKYLKIVNLYEEKDKKFCDYSLGMKQKLGIAQAIMEDQEIIILDEPFSGIDDASVNKIKEYLKEEKNKNKLILISSHVKEDLNELVDEVFYFDAGVIKQKDKGI